MDVGIGDGVIRDTDVSNESAGDGDVEDEVAVVSDAKEDWDGFGANSVAVLVVAEEEKDDEDRGPGEVVGEVDFSMGGDDFRGSLLGVVVLGAATGTADEIVRVMLAFPPLTMWVAVGGGVETVLEATISGLEIGALPDLLRMRCRSVDECRVSVDSSCCARFR